LEYQLYRELVEVYRSPEQIIERTRLKTEWNFEFYENPQSNNKKITLFFTCQSKHEGREEGRKIWKQILIYIFISVSVRTMFLDD
jgi:hypothetical protein